MPPPPCCSQISIISAISDVQAFQWNVLSYIHISKTFEWSVGTGPLKWYVVEAFHGGVCPTLPASECGNYIEYHTIAATSLSHLCRRLVDMGFNKKIKSIKVWSKPALECDVLSDTREGIDHSCNELYDVDFCNELCLQGFIPSNICPEMGSLVWYTEYLHLGFPEVSVNDVVILGQRLGRLIASPNGGESHLHFGLGDGGGGGNIGQTIDLTDFYSLPAVGTRASVSGPGINIFSTSDINYIKDRLRSPVDRASCDWHEYFGSVAHFFKEYYAMDWYCSGSSPPNNSSGIAVYCASGGPDVLTTVDAIVNNGPNGYGIILRHERQIVGPSENYSFAGNINFPPSIDCGLNCNHGTPGLISGYYSSPLEIVKPISMPMPKTINMKEVSLNEIICVQHNFHKSKVFGSFLERNNIKLDSKINLHYNENNNSWQFKKSFEANNEMWVLSVELCRESTKLWDFKISFLRKKDGVSKQSSFKIKFIFPAIDEFSLQINFLIKSKVLKLSLPYILKSNSILDDIGVFEGQWNSEFMTINIGDK